MTKEALEKEIRKYLKETFHHEYYDDVVMVMGFAEPREKRIAELEKENAKLKEYNKYLRRKRQGGIQKQYNKVAIIKQQDEQLTKAKEIMNIAIEGIKNWGFVSGTERPFEKQAEKLFNLFLDKAEQFLSEVEK